MSESALSIVVVPVVPAVPRESFMYIARAPKENRNHNEVECLFVVANEVIIIIVAGVVAAAAAAVRPSLCSLLNYVRHLYVHLFLYIHMYMVYRDGRNLFVILLGL